MAERSTRSLRTRIATWMAASTLLTVVVFAGAMYTAIRLEGTGGHGLVTPPDEVETDAEQLLWAMALSAPLALVAAVGGALWLARRALAPLELVIRAARETSAADLHRRLPAPRSGDELASLVEALNGLLARLEDGFASLGRYAADASHELRTPIAVVIADLEVALRRPRDGAEWTAVARRSLDELQRLATLVEDLLRLAKASDDAIRVRTRVDVREQVDLVLASLARSAAETGHVLSPASEGEVDAVWISGSADGIGSVVRNLIENALRYTPRGGTIRVSVNAERDLVVLEVDDSGPGVPPDEREGIFVPFRRGGDVASADRDGQRQRGFGLGLAIVRRIVEAHGGRILVDRSDLGGARFRVELPRVA